jgi:hypothetical protein
MKSRLARSASSVLLLSLLALPAYAQKAKKVVKPSEAPPPAAAVAPAGPKSLADTLTGDAKAAYEGGKILYGDGDYAGAKVKFQAAYDTAKDPRLLWNMAVCEKGLRHYARVVALTQQYLELGGPLITEEDRTEAKELLNAIESFTVALSLDVNEAGAEVTIDGEGVGTTPLPTAVTVDIGTRDIRVSKPGFKPFQSTLPLGGQKQASLKVMLVPELHEGQLNIRAPQGGRISIDGQQVGVGNWTGKLKSGGHTLRVEALGMRPYQSEVVLQDDEKRAVDVALEPIAAAATPAEQHGPLYDMELGFRTGYGWMNTKAKGRNQRDHESNQVGFIPLWLDIGYRLGRPTYLGVYMQFGWLDKSDTCGIARHGAMPDDVDDYATRFGYSRCLMAKAGVDLVFHVMPRTIVDPYFGFDVGVQGTFTKWRSYDPVTEQAREGQDNNGSVQPGFQLGIDVHPIETLGIGLFGHGAIHIGSNGEPHDDNQESCNNGVTPTGMNCCQGNCDSESDPGSHLMFGTRIAYTFP